eukprot:scaffold10261_cov248-Ochromonas_danica.AAC.3
MRLYQLLFLLLLCRRLGPVRHPPLNRPPNLQPSPHISHHLPQLPHLHVLPPNLLLSPPLNLPPNPHTNLHLPQLPHLHVLPPNLLLSPPLNLPPNHHLNLRPNQPSHLRSLPLTQAALLAVPALSQQVSPPPALLQSN